MEFKDKYILVQKNSWKMSYQKILMDLIKINLPYTSINLSVNYIFQ